MPDRVRRFLAALLAALALTALAPAEPVPTLSPDSEARWVPFQRTPGNQLLFTVELDGRPITAILDTGVSHSVLARRYAEAAKLRVQRRGSAQVIGGAVDIGSVPVRTLSFGGLSRSGGALAVADLPSLATGTATPVDMLVGRDLLAAVATDIDYRARRFRLLPSGRLPFAGTAAPLTISPDRLVFVTAVTIGGTRLQPVIVDTGDGGAVSLGERSWRAARPAVSASTDTVSFGLRGPVTSEVAIVPAFALGELTVRDVEVRIEQAGGFSEAIGVAGRIGSGLLQRYRVLLDPGAGRMVLSPAGIADAPRSTSGLLLGLAGDRLRVIHVMRGSPAATAGWRAGETICAVDGREVGGDPARTADWMSGRPGRRVRLTMCDGARRELRLARFY